MSKWNYVALFWCFLLAFTACQSQPTPAPTSTAVAQLPTATTTQTATFTAVPPTPTASHTPQPTNTPDRVATALAQPTRTSRPTFTPTSTPPPTSTPNPPVAFPPFTEPLQPFDTSNLPAPLLPLVNQYDGSISQVAVEGNWAYFNVGLRLVKMNINTPGRPTAVSDPLPLLPAQMEVANGRVYVLLPNDLLLAYEVGESWQLTEQLPLPAGDKTFFTYEEQVYLKFWRDNELWQLSSALELQQKISYPAGQLITQNLPQLYLVDYTAPVKLSQANLEQLPLTFTPLYTFTEPEYSDGYIYVDVGGDVVAVYRHSTQDAPLALYQIEGGQVAKVSRDFGDFDPYAGGATVNGNWLTTPYEGGDAGSCWGGADVFDITDPTNPQYLQPFRMGVAIYDLFNTPSEMYGSDGITFSQYNPLTTSPDVLWQSTGSITQLAQTSEGIWAMNDACDRSQIFEYLPTSPTSLTRDRAVEGFFQLLADSSTAYFLNDWWGLLAIQTDSNVLTGIDVDTSPYGSTVFYRLAINGYYAAALNSEGIVIYDTTNPTQWQLVAELLDSDTILYHQSVLWVDQMLYASARNTTTQQNEIHLIDVTDVTKPVTVGVLEGLEDVWLEAAGNGYLYTISQVSYPSYPQNQPQESNLYIYNIQNPTTPFLLTSIPFPEPIFSFYVDGTTAYALGDDLWVYDLSNPAAPQLIAYYPTPGRAYDLLITDTAVYLADGDAGVLVFEKPSQE